VVLPTYSWISTSGGAWDNTANWNVYPSTGNYNDEYRFYPFTGVSSYEVTINTDLAYDLLEGLDFLAAAQLIQLA